MTMSDAVSFSGSVVRTYHEISEVYRYEMMPFSAK